MKRISIFLLAFITTIGFNACSSDDDVVFVAQPDPEGISFVNSFNSQYILTSGTANNTAERFVWNTIDVDVPTNITYELQGSADPDFESFDVMGATGGNNVAVSVGQLLELAEDAGLDDDPTTDAPNSGQLYFRVVASPGTAGELAHTSEVEALTVVLPEDTGDEDEDPRELYLVGEATATGWDNTASGNNYPLFRDPANQDVYYYTGYFGAGEFKLIETKGQWQPQYGTNDGTTVAVNPGDGTDPGAFTVDAAGYYSFEININEMTFSLEEFDGDTDTTYSSIGIVGPAQEGGWDADTDMIQSDFDPHIWYVTDIELSAGEFKFRADDAWDANWGVDSEALSGQANFGSNANMVAQEGTYDIWFNDLTGRYILIPKGE